MIERLYIGSKSEGDYPMFKSSDGLTYRLEIKFPENQTPTADHLIGRDLHVRGTCDLLKGYRRLVTTLEDIQVIESKESEPSNPRTLVSDAPSNRSPS